MLEAKHAKTERDPKYAPPSSISLYKRTICFVIQDRAQAGYQEKGRVQALAESRRIDYLLWEPQRQLETGLSAHFARDGPHERTMSAHITEVLTHASRKHLSGVRVTLDPAPVPTGPSSLLSQSAPPPTMGAIEKELVSYFLNETVGRGVNGLCLALFGNRGGFVARHLSGFLTNAAGFVVTSAILAKIEEWLYRDRVERDLRNNFRNAIYSWTLATHRSYVERMHESLADLQIGAQLAAEEQRLFLVVQSEANPQ